MSASLDRDSRTEGGQYGHRRLLRVVAVSPVHEQPGARRFILRSDEQGGANYTFIDPDGSCPWQLTEGVMVMGASVGLAADAAARKSDG